MVLSKMISLYLLVKVGQAVGSDAEWSGSHPEEGANSRSNPGHCQVRIGLFGQPGNNPCSCSADNRHNSRPAHPCLPGGGGGLCLFGENMISPSSCHHPRVMICSSCIFVFSPTLPELFWRLIFDFAILLQIRSHKLRIFSAVVFSKFKSCEVGQNDGAPCSGSVCGERY